MSKIRAWCDQCRRLMFAGANTHIIAALCMMGLIVFFIVGLCWYRSLGVKETQQVSTAPVAQQTTVPAASPEASPSGDVEEMKRELRIIDRSAEQLSDKSAASVTAAQEQLVAQAADTRTVKQAETPEQKRTHGRKKIAARTKNNRAVQARSRQKNLERPGRKKQRSKEEIRKRVAQEVAKHAAAIPVGEIGEKEAEVLSVGKE